MKPIVLLSVGCALLLSLPAYAALRGVALYERGNYARARRVLEQELRSPKLTQEERITARLYLAAALHASGAKEASSVQLEELVLTAPGLRVDPVLFPPAFVALAESIRQRVEAERLAREQSTRAPAASPPVAPAPAQSSSPSRAPSQSNEFQTYLNAAMRLYESLEYEQALERLSRAKRYGQGVEDDVIISLYEGIIHADMGRKEQAQAAFRDGLLLRPDAKLPVKVSPKVEQDFEAVRQDVRRELDTLHAKQQAQQPRTQEQPLPAPEAGSLRLRPEVFGFLAPLGQRTYGLGGGLSLGFGALEAGARVLLGEDLGVGAEVGLLLGSGKVQPRLGLRGTFVPGQPSYGGGAVVGLRLHPASRLTFLVDVGAEYFAVPNGYRSFVLTSSAGVGFDLL